MKSPNPSIAIAGGSGLIGQAMVHALKSRGCAVKQLIRSHPHKDTSQEVYWNPTSGHIERVGLEGVDVVINLAGVNLADKRWTPTQKELLLQSRVQSTRLLCKTIAKLKKPPELLISASASGYYGHNFNSQFDESSPAGTDFLATLCQEWEAATAEAEKIGVRVIHMRTGPVLESHHGFLAALLPFFKYGFGAYLGSGEQVISWISLADWVAVCEYLIYNSKWSGAVNLTAPNPVTNFEFGKILAEVLHRPYKLRIPERLIAWGYGEMGKSLLLEGSRVLPQRLLDSDFEFQYPELRKALQACMTK
ncbi:MAG: TIGR01777 family oxidoreductase [Myxococcaceae bacterium]